MNLKRSAPRFEKRSCAVCGRVFQPRTPQHAKCSDKCRRAEAKAKLIPVATVDRFLLGEAAECFVAADLMRRNVIVFRNVARTGPADMVVWSPDRQDLALIDVKSVTTGYRRADGLIALTAPVADGVHLAFVVGDAVVYSEPLRHLLGIPDLPCLSA